MVWTDSVKMLTAEDKLGALQQKYDSSLQTIQEKEDQLSAKQYIIAGLCTLAAILIAALAFLAFLVIRFILLNRKLKKIIQTITEHSEQQTGFIQSISAQMEPTLDEMSKSVAGLQITAPRQAKSHTSPYRCPKTVRKPYTRTFFVEKLLAGNLRSTIF